MVELTDKLDLQKFSEGESPWSHSQDMETLDLEITKKRSRAPDTAQETPDNGAVFLNLSTGEIFVGDGTSWGTPRWNLDNIGSGGGSGDPTAVEGIASTTNHAGAFPHGELVEQTSTGDPWGVLFWGADSLSINSCVLDCNVDNTNVNELNIELYQVDSYIDETGVNGTLVDTANLTGLTNGAQRVDLNFTLPAAGEYVLAPAGVPDANGNAVAVRRTAGSGGPAWTGWDDYTFDNFDLRQGARVGSSTSNDWSQTYFYIFDISYGVGADRVNSPWSHDVEEIYMRPRDPAEEYDVGPRALWIDTS